MVVSRWHAGRSKLPWLLMILSGSCHSAHRPSGVTVQAGSIVEALVRGDQSQVDVFTREFFATQAAVRPEWLSDDRDVSRQLILKWETPEHIYQLGVDRVSDFFLCLLELRARTNTREIVQTSFPGQVEGCVSEACEVCNSLTYALADDVRDKLIEYWSASREEANPVTVSPSD